MNFESRANIDMVSLGIANRYLAKPSLDGAIYYPDLNKAIVEVFATLTEKEVKVLKLRFGLDGEDEHTLIQAAIICNVSRTRIAAIEARALYKLRHPSRIKKLRPFATMCLHL